MAVRFGSEQDSAGASFSRLKKLASSPRTLASDPAQVVEVIVKVARPHYVPPGVAVRAQISPQLFTSVIAANRLHDLDDDPEVQSFSINQALRTIG